MVRFVFCDRPDRAILISCGLMFFAVDVVTVANVPLAHQFHASPATA
jgi:hypothetical protein